MKHTPKKPGSSAPKIPHNLDNFDKRRSNVQLDDPELSDADDDPELSDADLVRQTLRLIMRDQDAPAAAKAQAARTLAEMARLIGGNAKSADNPDDPVRELDRDALLRAALGED